MNVRARGQTAAEQHDARDPAPVAPPSTRRAGGAHARGSSYSFHTSQRLASVGGTCSGHSLRAGFATSAAAAGVPERDIMRQTRHRSIAVFRDYVRKGSLFLDNPVGKLL